MVIPFLHFLHFLHYLHFLPFLLIVARNSLFRGTKYRIRTIEACRSEQLGPNSKRVSYAKNRYKVIWPKPKHLVGVDRSR